jgi:hypothetical protein
MNLVHRVCRPVLGLANTKGHVTCHVQLLAILCHATNVAPRDSNVDINVPESAVKYVPKVIANNVRISFILELTSSR